VAWRLMAGALLGITMTAFTPRATRGVGYALRVVAAGVGDYSAFAFFAESEAILFVGANGV